MAGAKFWTSTVLLLNAAFISLSEAAGEPRRCYWCGPLAEQVHRSQRSAPCGTSVHTTTCEPGYNYCAIVATSPPQVESRYCVKMYQDECYPVFCNSTKTWKMTCPCRGDLCNGPNTERETEAFALLPKLVAKTHNARIKKRTANSSPHLIKHDTKLRIISNDDTKINNESQKLIVSEEDFDANSNDSTQHPDDMQSDKQTNIVVEHHDEQENDDKSTDTNQENVQSTTTSKQLIEIEIHVSGPTVGADTMNENVQPCSESPSTTNPDELSTKPEQAKQEEIPIATIETVQNNEPPVKTSQNDNVIQSEEPSKVTDTVQKDSVVTSTQVSHSESPMQSTEIMSNDEPLQPEYQITNEASFISTADSNLSVKTTEVVKIDQPDSKDTIKSSEVIPTAEAFQQNGSPVPVTIKATQASTIETPSTTTITTTQKNIDTMTTTPPASPRKNSVGRVTFSGTLLIGCFVFL